MNQSPLNPISISVRSYNEHLSCVNLAISIRSSFQHALEKGILQFGLRVDWHDNTRDSGIFLYDSLNAILGDSIELHLHKASNSSFSYWRSVETAILGSSAPYVLILSGHCIIEETLLYDIAVAIEASRYDCLIVPTFINPVVGASDKELFYNHVLCSPLFARISTALQSRFLAAFAFSNSNAVYCVDSVFRYPIPRVEGNEDSIWISSYPVTFGAVGSGVMHSHNLLPTAEFARVNAVKSHVRAFRSESNSSVLLHLVSRLALLCVAPFMAMCVALFKKLYSFRMRTKPL